MSTIDERAALEKAYIVISAIVSNKFTLTEDMRQQIKLVYDEITPLLWPESFDVLECGCIFPYAQMDPMVLCKKHKRVKKWIN